MVFFDLNLFQKKVLLYNELIKDGADSETAVNVIENTRFPVTILRNNFGYTDDTKIDEKLLSVVG